MIADIRKTWLSNMIHRSRARQARDSVAHRTIYHGSYGRVLRIQTYFTGPERGVMANKAQDPDEWVSVVIIVTDDTI